VIGGTPEERIHGGLVVGADGRFSAIARAVRAPIVEEANEHTSTVYFAEWEDVGKPRAEAHGGHICTNGRGLDVLFFAMPRGRFSVNTHARADRVDIAGDAERYYLDALRSMPSAAKRLEGARRVTDVVGIKRIGNGYRQATGPGWALVGDALHYTDPVDGQGIYDALIEARLLDDALAHGTLESYGDAVRAATRPMFLATTARLRRELYSEPPVAVIRTLLRWLITDREYQTRFLRYLNRDVPAERWLTPGLAVGAAVRGIARDARGVFTQ
jgi:flavin-dependent dehydrogenase